MITAEHPIYGTATFGLFSVREKRGCGGNDNFARLPAGGQRCQNGAISRLSVIV